MDLLQIFALGVGAGVVVYLGFLGIAALLDPPSRKHAAEASTRAGASATTKRLTINVPRTFPAKNASTSPESAVLAESVSPSAKKWEELSDTRAALPSIVGTTDSPAPSRDSQHATVLAAWSALPVGAAASKSGAPERVTTTADSTPTAANTTVGHRAPVWAAMATGSAVIFTLWGLNCSWAQSYRDSTNAAAAAPAAQTPPPVAKKTARVPSQRKAPGAQVIPGPNAVHQNLPVQRPRSRAAAPPRRPTWDNQVGIPAAPPASVPPTIVSPTSVAPTAVPSASTTTSRPTTTPPTSPAPSTTAAPLPTSTTAKPTPTTVPSPSTSVPTITPTATPTDGSPVVQRIEVTVTAEEFTPSYVVAQAGVWTELVFKSVDAAGCITSVVIPELDMKIELPENGETVVDLGVFGPQTLTYACSMDMYRGHIEFRTDVTQIPTPRPPL